MDVQSLRRMLQGKNPRVVLHKLKNIWQFNQNEISQIEVQMKMNCSESE